MEQNLNSNWTKLLSYSFSFKQLLNGHGNMKLQMNKICILFLHYWAILERNLNTELSPKNIEKALDNLLTSTKPQLVKLKKIESNHEY